MERKSSYSRKAVYQMLVDIIDCASEQSRLNHLSGLALVVRPTCRPNRIDETLLAELQFATDTSHSSRTTTERVRYVTTMYNARMLDNSGSLISEADVRRFLYPRNNF